MANYDLTIARVDESKSPPVIVVLVPWKYFCHGMGPPEYCRAIAHAKNIAVAVSLSPKGEWHCDTHSVHHWKRIISETPPENLGWHTMKVVDGQDPEEQMESYIAMGIRE